MVIFVQRTPYRWRDEWLFLLTALTQKQFGLSPVATDLGLMNVRLWSFTNAKAWEWSFVLWGRKPVWHAVSKARCTWRRIRFYLHCSLDSFSLEPPRQEALGSPESHVKRIQVSVPYERICDGSWTRNKAIKTMSGSIQGHISTHEFGFEEKCRKVIRIPGGWVWANC